jgi:hypothetical protein
MLISVLTEAKLLAIDAKLVGMAGANKKKGKKGWLDVMCTDPVVFAFVLKQWLAEVGASGRKERGRRQAGWMDGTAG